MVTILLVVVMLALLPAALYTVLAIIGVIRPEKTDDSRELDRRLAEWRAKRDARPSLMWRLRAWYVKHR